MLNIQEEGGITKTVEAAVAAVHELLPEANSWRRTEQPASKICLAMECGGSDGNSGVTANPALGVAADLLVAQGGTAVLGETTEIYGAEHLLTRRAVTREVGEKLVERIKWWEWYTGIFGAEINNNPSPGNKEGGLTTIYEKSLGALAKAGSTALVDVVDYAERVDKPGLIFMDTPGYDPLCTTGLVAGGANVLVFTTGRGSVLGLKPTPCIKVATNTPMYEQMIDDMDIDAGAILEGEPVEERRPAALRGDPRRGERRPTRRASSTASARRSSPPGPSGRPCERTPPGQDGRPRPCSSGPGAHEPARSVGLASPLAGTRGTGLAGLVPGRAAAERDDPGGPDPAGAAPAQGVPRGRPRDDVPPVAPGPGGRRAEPPREPARADPDPRRRRAHRAGGAGAGGDRAGRAAAAGQAHAGRADRGRFRPGDVRAGAC